MSEKQQTAVEWLQENLIPEYGNFPDAIVKLFEQAKEMEKKQIEYPYLDGYCETAEDSQDYYDKTYSK